MGTEIMCEMADGSKLTVRKDKTHYRAFSSDGKQVGDAWIKLSSLQDELKFKIVTEPAPGSAPQGEAAGAAPEAAAGPEASAPSADPAPELPAASMTADRSVCGHFKDEVCGMDDQACDGQCGEHAARAPKEDKKEQPADEHQADAA